MRPNSVRVSRVICATADSSFEAWMDPQRLMHWWRQKGKGWAFAGAPIDLRVGGRYRLAIAAPDGRVHVAVGEYRQIDRPVRLVPWDWEQPANSAGDTLVSVEFSHAGVTQLRS